MMPASYTNVLNIEPGIPPAGQVLLDPAKDSSIYQNLNIFQEILIAKFSFYIQNIRENNDTVKSYQRMIDPDGRTQSILCPGKESARRYRLEFDQCLIYFRRIFHGPVQDN